MSAVPPWIRSGLTAASKAIFEAIWRPGETPHAKVLALGAVAFRSEGT